MCSLLCVQLALCVRFVNSSQNIREEFLDSIYTGTAGKDIAGAIMAALQAHALPLSDIRGQGYDGAAAMSSNTVGEQARLCQESPLAVCNHCSGHCLNPVIAGSCAIVSIRNMMDKLKETCLFFSNSPKREAILISVMSTDEPHAHRKKPSSTCVEQDGWSDKMRT